MRVLVCTCVCVCVCVCVYVCPCVHVFGFPLPVLPFHSHFDVVTSLSFHPVDPLIVTGSQDCSIKVWSLHSKKPYVPTTHTHTHTHTHTGFVWWGENLPVPLFSVKAVVSD